MEKNREVGVINAGLDVLVSIEKMHEEGMEPVVNSKNITLDASWTITQVI